VTQFLYGERVTFSLSRSSSGTVNLTLSKFIKKKGFFSKRKKKLDTDPSLCSQCVHAPKRSCLR